MLTAPINVPRLHAQHQTAIRQFFAAINHASHEAAVATEGFVRTHKPGFRPLTGRTQKSVRTRVVRLRGGAKVRVFSHNKVARFMDLGTRPHIIEPRRKSHLVFRWRGNWVAAKRVHHPGTMPYRFMWRAARHGHRMHGHYLEARLNAVAAKF
jgi:hypothetical protein